jgi:hypothetical protein
MAAEKAALRKISIIATAYAMGVSGLHAVFPVIARRRLRRRGDLYAPEAS